MHPILFHIGSHMFTSYGAMMGVGFSCSYLLARWVARRQGLKPGHFKALFVLIVVLAIFGSHILDIGVRWLQGTTGAVNLSYGQSGMTEMGGLILAPLGAFAYLFWQREPLLPYFDCLALVTPLGLGFGRIGCFFNGCCYGKPSTLPWAVTYPPTHLTAGVPVHPAPLYMWALMWLLCAGLFLVQRKAWRHGQVLVAFLVGYPLIRFFQEMVRADADRGSWFGGTLSTYQMLSLLTLVVSVPLAVRLFQPNSTGRPVYSSRV